MQKHKKRKQHTMTPEGMTELNVMPFVDIFSLLCTFLLFTAVFVSVGIHEVQVPFFSNAAPEPEKKPERSLIVTIHVEPDEIALSTAFTLPPLTEDKKVFARNPDGLLDFHRELLQLRRVNQKSDKVTLFVADSIIYADLVAVLDQIKLLFPGDEGFQATSQDGGPKLVGNDLFPKVVMGDVVL